MWLGINLDFQILCYTRHMASNNTYIALLRGINVGGNNIIKMTELKAFFEAMGFTNVVTYIQSGNVVFRALRKEDDLALYIEKSLKGILKKDIKVVVVSSLEMRNIVDNAPLGFGKEPEKYRSDVLFLKPPLTTAEALLQIPVKEGVDTITEGKGVVYYTRLMSKATESKLSRLITLPLYKDMTIRNWNTTVKLATLSA